MAQRLMTLVGLLVLAACEQGSQAGLDAVRTREDALSLRETFLARREAGVVQRETTLGMREQALALREERIARRESMAGLTDAERRGYQNAAAGARQDVVNHLAALGLDLRDADSALEEHVATGDMLAQGRDYLAAEIAYRAAQAFAAGTKVDEARVRRALERATAAFQARQDAGVDSLANAHLLQARGLMVDGRFKDAMKLIKDVEGPMPPQEAKR